MLISFQARPTSHQNTNADKHQTEWPRARSFACTLEAEKDGVNERQSRLQRKRLLLLDVLVQGTWSWQQCCSRDQILAEVNAHARLFGSDSGSLSYYSILLEVEDRTDVIAMLEMIEDDELHRISRLRRSRGFARGLRRSRCRLESQPIG